MNQEAPVLLKPHTRDVSGLSVRRLLPGQPQKMVGPFIFFDHMGPAGFAPGGGVDVRPHPHIGLATVTYLFTGELLHRDNLGTVQRIAPGDVNWMTAGRGIVHSERTPPDARTDGAQIHGIQTWVALPRDSEQVEPAFSHHPKATIPRLTETGVEMSLIAGRLFGARAPTPTFSEMFYLAVSMKAGARLELPPEHEERGMYVAEGDVIVAGQAVPPQHLFVVTHRKPVTIRATTPARLLLIGGAQMDGDRHIWWNYVASSRDLIEDAKLRWKEQRFTPIAGETEFIPLPER